VEVEELRLEDCLAHLDHLLRGVVSGCCETDAASVNGSVDEILVVQRVEGLEDLSEVVLGGCKSLFLAKKEATHRSPVLPQEVRVLEYIIQGHVRRLLHENDELGWVTRIRQGQFAIEDGKQIGVPDFRHLVDFVLDLLELLPPLACRVIRGDKGEHLQLKRSDRHMRVADRFCEVRGCKSAWNVPQCQNAHRPLETPLTLPGMEELDAVEPDSVNCDIGVEGLEWRV
jgi:hypothetical protein